MKFVFGLVALLVFCSSVSGYIYIRGEEQILPGEEVFLEVCGEKGNVKLNAYEVDPGILYEFMASQDDEEILNETFDNEPVYSTNFRITDWCNDVTLPAFDKGIYIVVAKMGEEEATSLIVVSRLGVVSKSGDKELLVYAVDLVDGKAVSGVDLKIYDKDKIRDSGTTNGEGIFKTEVNTDSDLAIIGEKDGDIALLSSYYYGSWIDSSKTYIYTDRPVYRPNQDVYFKAIVWEKTANGYKVPTGEMQVEIKDAKGNLVLDKNIKINDFGSVSGKFTLGDEPPLGYYSINTMVDGLSNGYGSFQVEEYKKPEYQVTLSPQDTKYIRGDVVNVEIDASYYFGSPVSDAEVEYTIRESSWYYPCRGYMCYYIDYDEPYYYGYGNEVDSGSGVTSGDGKLMVSFVADNDNNAVYVIEARVTDKSRREVEGSTSVVVARGEFDFLITTDRYSYTKGEKATITINSEDLEGNGISAFGKLTINRRTWDRVYRKYDEATILEEDVETNSDGVAIIEFVPDKAGSFYITIEGEDSRGNNITSRGYMYVRDKQPTWDRWESLELILDKEIYEVGDVSKITINSPTPNFNVLLTVEGLDVYEYYEKEFEGTTGTIEVPVLGKYSPNIQIYALVVKNKTQYSATQNLVAPPIQNFLKVEITSDKEEYMPRDEATFTVKTTDQNGNPVATELSLGIVDESIYAIVEDTLMDIEEFFYGRTWSNVRTTTSWQYWGRGIFEDELGDVAAGAVLEEGDLAAPEARMAKSEGLVTPETRRYFPDTAFWHAHVKTDENGVATVRVTMPDSLTTWRATARAIDKNFKVGQNTDKVISRKNLIVRLETPRFFTQNDELIISAVVHNYLGKMKDVVVELEANGVELLDDASRTVSIAHGGDERIDWRIKVNGCCDANFTVKALTDMESDAMELKVPIVPYGVEEQEVWAGTVEDSLTKNILVPEESVFGATELSVVISPSIASTAFDALEYLTGYPYGCVEQTMSSFLPDVYVAQVLRDLDLKNEKLEEELPDMVSKGLQRLYKLQHSDGGWGWWENDETHSYMTAYVVYGLTQAKKADFTVDENVLQRGLNSLRDQYKKEEDANIKAYMAYSLSFYETPSEYPDNNKLNDYGKALMTLSMLNTGETNKFPQSLKNSAICDELVCHWTSDTYKYGWRNNDVETTAFTLMALLKTEPQNEMVEKTVRWLVTNRRGKRWGSTKDTAIAVFALSDYLKISKELSPNYVANVYLNGELVESVKKDDAFSIDNEIKLDPKVGLNKLRIEKDGEGKLYYAIVLKYFREEEGIKAKSSGIMVNREYNVTSVRSGEYIEVKLTVDVPNDLEYVILEDPLPAGCEVIEEQNYYDYWWRWDYWYSQKEVRDEKVAYFMTYLRPGKNEITYTLRAEIPGSYKVMPATAWNMYDEKIRGHSAENQIEISDKLIVRIGDVSIDDNSVDFSVDSLKMIEDDLSGEIVVQIKELDGTVLKEVREYVSIKESSNRQEMSVPISLKDGLYTLAYSITTSDKDTVVGSKRIQVGEVEIIPVKPPVKGPIKVVPTKEKGDDGTPLIILLILLFIAFFVLMSQRIMRSKKSKKKK